VIRRARQRLQELERNAQRHRDEVTAQLGLFAEEAATPRHPALEALAGIDADGLSPREALTLLYELRAMVEGDGG
jgi:DNA mismatch repair protein MutS